MLIIAGCGYDININKISEFKKCCVEFKEIDDHDPMRRYYINNGFKEWGGVVNFKHTF